MTVKEYADYRGVHPVTIIRWIRRGRLPADQPGGKNGHYAIPVDAIVKTFPAAPDTERKL